METRNEEVQMKKEDCVKELKEKLYNAFNEIVPDFGETVESVSRAILFNDYVLLSGLDLKEEIELATFLDSLYSEMKKQDLVTILNHKQYSNERVEAEIVRLVIFGCENVKLKAELKHYHFKDEEKEDKVTFEIFYSF